MQPTNYSATPFECNNDEVIKYFKAIAKARNIIIEDLGGIENTHSGSGDYTSCNLAYKTSDMSDLSVLGYDLSRDEDFNMVLVTEDDQ